MSSMGEGFFPSDLSPEDQEAMQALRRRQAYANALMSQGAPQGRFGGLADAGSKLMGAFLSKRTDAREADLAKTIGDRNARDWASVLGGDASGGQMPAGPPASPSAAMPPTGAPGPIPPPAPPTALPGQVPAATAGAPPMAPMPAGAPPGPAPAPPAANPQSAMMGRLLATGNPALLRQFGPMMVQQQMNRDNTVWERGLPMTQAQKDEAALNLQNREAGATFENQLPMNAAQRAEDARAKAQLGLGYAQLNKPMSVGFGDTVISPATGKVIYGGQMAQSPLGPDGKPLTGAAYLATLPPGLASTAKAIAEYRQAPLTAMALRSPQGAALMQAVNQINPGYDSTQYGSKNKARLDFATGKNGNTVRSLNVAVQHLDQLGQLATTLGNGDVQGFNRLGQFIAQQTGHPAPANFDAAKNIVADEVVKAVIGSGGGVGDREAAANAVSRASSPQQLAGVIQTYQGLMSGQLSGLKQQYEKSTGLNDFEDYLAPETKAKLQARAGGQSANAPQGVPQGWTVRQK